MQATHPLSLLLVVLLAFWTPVGQCCAAEANPASPAPAENEPLPPCHPQPAEVPAPCDTSSDCDDDTCQCTPLMRSACEDEHATAAVPGPGQPQLPVVPAVLLPGSMQPHTIAVRLARPFPGSAPPPAGAPSLIALNCQLTL